MYSSAENPSIPNFKNSECDVPPCLFGYTLTSVGHKNYLVTGRASIEYRDKILYLSSNHFEKQTVLQYLLKTFVIETDEETVTVFRGEKHYFGEVAQRAHHTAQCIENKLYVFGGFFVVIWKLGIYH